MAKETAAELSARAEEIRNETVPKGITKTKIADILQNVIDTAALTGTGSGRGVVLIGVYDASATNNYPIAANGGTGVAGAPQKGNLWVVSVRSTPDGNGDVKFPLGAKIMALIDNPGTTDSNWNITLA